MAKEKNEIRRKKAKAATRSLPGRPPNVRPDALELALEHGAFEGKSIANNYLKRKYDAVSRRDAKTGTPPTNLGNANPSSRVGKPAGYSAYDIPLPEDATKNQILDREISHALRSGGAINLDEAFPDVGLTDATPLNPADRARLVLIHGKRYQLEYVLKTLHRLLLRHVPNDQIARVFNVTVETIYDWRKMLYDRVREEATNLDVYSIAGESLAFYSELRSIGMNMATSDDIRVKDIGLSVALKSEADKHKMLQTMGFYNVAQLVPSNKGNHDPHSADSVVQMMKDVLSGNYKPEEASPEEKENEVSLDFFK